MSLAIAAWWSQNAIDSLKFPVHPQKVGIQLTCANHKKNGADGPEKGNFGLAKSHCTYDAIILKNAIVSELLRKTFCLLNWNGECSLPLTRAKCVGWESGHFLQLAK